MIPFSTAPLGATSGALTWSRISCNRRHELRLNGEAIGELKRPSFWSANFVAETQHGTWKFRRSGFWGNLVEVVDEASSQPIASFKPGYSRGALSFADGQTFKVTHKGWWRSDREWSATFVRTRAREESRTRRRLGRAGRTARSLDYVHLVPRAARRGRRGQRGGDGSGRLLARQVAGHWRERGLHSLVK